MTLDRTPVFQSNRLLTINALANIDGALRVHDLSTWPENQRLFVFCTEPTLFAEPEEPKAPCRDLDAIAYA